MEPGHIAGGVRASAGRTAAAPVGEGRAGTRSAYWAVLFLIPGYGIAVVYLLIANGTESHLITASSAAFLLIFLAAFVAGIRLLETRAMRLTAWATSAITVTMLPFFGVSVFFALGILVAAVIAERFIRPERAGAAAWDGAVTAQQGTGGR